MSYTERFTETHDYLGGLPPTVTVNAAVGAHPTGWMNMADYHRLFVFIDIGEPAVGATIDVAVWQATSAAGAGAVVMPLKAPNQITVADVGEHVGIELRTEELNVTGGFSFVQVIATVGVDVYVYSLTVWGIISRYEAVGVADFLQVVP